MSICLVKQNDGTWVEKHKLFLFNVYKRFFLFLSRFFNVFNVFLFFFLERFFYISGKYSMQSLETTWYVAQVRRAVCQ